MALFPKTSPHSASTRHGLRGRLDESKGLSLRGWAHDDRQSEPVEVCLMADGQAVASTRAHHYREDLARHGIGTGHCAFLLQLPLSLLDGRPHRLQLRTAQGEPLDAPAWTLHSDASTGLLRDMSISKADERSPWRGALAQVAALAPETEVLVLIVTPSNLHLPALMELRLCGQGFGHVRPELVGQTPNAQTLWCLRAPALSLRPGQSIEPPEGPLSIELGMPGSPPWRIWSDTNSTAADFVQQLGATHAQHHLDTAFYRAWYADVGAMSDAELRAHYAQFGYRERRHPHFNAMVRAELANVSELPKDFDWRCYLALNPDLARQVPRDRYHVSDHYLRRGRAERRSHGIDAEFYAERYLGLPVGAQVPDLDLILNDFLAHAGEGRQPSFAAWLLVQGLEQSQLILDADLRALRQEWAGRPGPDFWHTLHGVLSMPPAQRPLGLSTDPSLEASIAQRLARHLWVSGRLRHAEALMTGQVAATLPEHPTSRWGLLLRPDAGGVQAQAWLLDLGDAAPPARLTLRSDVGEVSLPLTDDADAMDAPPLWCEALNLLPNADFALGLAHWQTPPGSQLQWLGNSPAPSLSQAPEQALCIEHTGTFAPCGAAQTLWLRDTRPLRWSVHVGIWACHARLVATWLDAQGHPLSEVSHDASACACRQPRSLASLSLVSLPLVPPTGARALRLLVEKMPELGPEAPSRLLVAAPVLALGDVAPGQWCPPGPAELPLGRVRRAHPVPLAMLQALGALRNGQVMSTDNGLDECRVWRDAMLPELPLSNACDDSDAGIHQVDAPWYRLAHGLAPHEDVWAHFCALSPANLLSPNPQCHLLAEAERHSQVLPADDLPTLLTFWQRRARLPAPPQVAPLAEAQARLLYTPLQLAAVRSVFAFDAPGYGERRPELAGSGVDLHEHYTLHGEREGTWPNPVFDPTYYRSQGLPADWHGTALSHFLRFGLLQGRMPSAEVAAGVANSGVNDLCEWALRWLGFANTAALPRHAITRESPVATKAPTEPPPRLGLGQVQRRRLNWVIPRFSKGGGGHTTIFRCARTLSRLGWESVFWISGVKKLSDLAKQQAEYLLHFPSACVSFRRLQDGFSEIEHEVILATAWQTVDDTLSNHQPNARLYFVQDHEPLFNSAGSDSIRAEWTYRQGFDFICAGPWLQHMVAEHGGRSTSFELCAEPQFSETDPPLDERPLLAAVYVRSHTSRRCSDMMLDVAGRLASAGLGRVAIFGDDSRPLQVPPGVVNMGILSSQQMAALFARCRFGLVASATNYSILPVEMGAAGLIVCQPDSVSTRATTVARGVHSFAPDAASMAEAIIEMARSLDTPTFEALRQPYMSFARSLSWEAEFDSIGEWLDKFMAPAVPLSARPTVTVVIPTYRADELLLEVVDAALTQHCSAEVDLLIIDSRSREADASPVIRQVSERPGVTVIAIDVQDFGHARTRQLGADRCSSDYVVYLTQDAVPDGPYWLESLLAPLRQDRRCGWSFSRHRAHAWHPKLCDAELSEHFDNFVSRGVYVSREMLDRPGEDDPYRLANLCFNSDNSAAYCGALLRSLKFPEVPFAEDQAMARRLLDAGYKGAYAHASIVRHSHDYRQDLDSARLRGEEEAQSLFTNFGIIRYRSMAEWQTDVVHASRKSRALGISHGATAADVADQDAVKRAYMQGAWRRSQALLAEHPPARRTP